MEALFLIILYIHIGFGTLSLLVGTLIMIKKKGDKVHKRMGQWYTLSMVINGLASFFLSMYHPNYFLFIVGVFSTYMALSGYRITKLKSLGAGQKASAFDWLLTSTMAVFGLGFLILGAYNLYSGFIFGLVFITFGLISAIFVVEDYRYYTLQKKDKLYWMKNHISKMVGSYIAAFTAFLVVNNTMLPDVIAWLLPTIIGTFLIAKWRSKMSGI